MNKRFFALDGIRGYAALAVLIYHAILAYDSSLIKRVLNTPIQLIPSFYDKLVKLALVLFNGQVAVLLFFILSGMVLSLALRKSVLHNPLFFNLEFVLKRIVRIYPTLIVSLTIAWVAQILLHQLNPDIYRLYGLKQLAQNALLMNSIINGATWTLQVEVLAVPFLLIFFFVQKRFGMKGLMVILFYLTLTLDNKALRLPIIPEVLYQTLASFVCGFLIASESAEAFFIMLAKDSRILLLSFICLIFTPLVVRPLSVSSLTVQLFCGSIFLGIIYYRQFMPVVKFLENRPSVYLGKISYSFYLNNVIFLNILYPVFALYFPTKQHPLEFGFLTSILCVFLTIALSHLTEKYVEQPSIKLGKLITRFFSSIETKYSMRPVLNTDPNTGAGLQSGVTVDREILKE